MNNTIPVIESLEELERWYPSSGEEKPVVWDWFTQYIFEDVCKNNKGYEAYDRAWKAMVHFTINCENMELRDSMLRVNENLRYLYHRGYSNVCGPSFKEYFNKMILNHYGI